MNKSIFFLLTMMIIAAIGCSKAEDELFIPNKADGNGIEEELFIPKASGAEDELFIPEKYQNDDKSNNRSAANGQIRILGTIEYDEADCMDGNPYLITASYNDFLDEIRLDLHENPAASESITSINWDLHDNLIIDGTGTSFVVTNPPGGWPLGFVMNVEACYFQGCNVSEDVTFCFNTSGFMTCGASTGTEVGDAGNLITCQDIRGNSFAAITP